MRKMLNILLAAGDFFDYFACRKSLAFMFFMDKFEL